jgi:hypothetical protein
MVVRDVVSTHSTTVTEARVHPGGVETKYWFAATVNRCVDRPRHDAPSQGEHP